METVPPTNMLMGLATGPAGLAGSMRKEGVTGSDGVGPAARSAGLVRQQGMCSDLKHTGRLSSPAPPTPGLGGKITTGVEEGHRILLFEASPAGPCCFSKSPN